MMKKGYFGFIWKITFKSTWSFHACSARLLLNEKTNSVRNLSISDSCVTVLRIVHFKFVGLSTHTVGHAPLLKWNHK